MTNDKSRESEWADTLPGFAAVAPIAPTEAPLSARSPRDDVPKSESTPIRNP